ncbi:MAG: chemotaxis-specific protein-glutamate methyltransferase CheB [Gemmatimonadaceae bacterium]|nr:chemotaxis-specific protein-glutamate methyltransferase CheB [Gemmatimonadaceae bacterium]
MANAFSSRRTVLVVDDSPFIRQVVRDLIDSSPEFVVIGEAGDGHAALAMVHERQPDLVTLDVQMPGLDGLATLGYLMSEAPRPIVMLSALGDGGETTMRALELGAVDFVRKPGSGDVLDLVTLRERLLGALRTAVSAHYRSVPVLARARSAAGGRVRTPPALSALPVRAATHVVIIASSTGGPRALAEIVPSLAIGDAAVVICQHMPPGFTESLARRLDALASVPVTEAVDGELLAAGRVYVAPGGVQTTLHPGQGTLRLAVRPGPPVHGVVPAADPLLRTAAEHLGPRAIAVILTGMGHDGARGTRLLREAGGFAIVQDEQTSIVYGMPHAALALAGADNIAPLGEVAAAIATGLQRRGCDVERIPASAPGHGDVAPRLRGDADTRKARDARRPATVNSQDDA